MRAPLRAQTCITKARANKSDIGQSSRHQAPPGTREAKGRGSATCPTSWCRSSTYPHCRLRPSGGNCSTHSAAGQREPGGCWGRKIDQPRPRSGVWGTGQTWVRGWPNSRRREHAMSQRGGGGGSMWGQGRGWPHHRRHVSVGGPVLKGRRRGGSQGVAQVLISIVGIHVPWPP